MFLSRQTNSLPIKFPKITRWCCYSFPNCPIWGLCCDRVEGLGRTEWQGRLGTFGGLVERMRTRPNIPRPRPEQQQQQTESRVGRDSAQTARAHLRPNFFCADIVHCIFFSCWTRLLSPYLILPEQLKQTKSLAGRDSAQTALAHLRPKIVLFCRHCTELQISQFMKKKNRLWSSKLSCGVVETVRRQHMPTRGLKLLFFCRHCTADYCIIINFWKKDQTSVASSHLTRAFKADKVELQPRQGTDSMHSPRASYEAWMTFCQIWFLQETFPQSVSILHFACMFMFKHTKIFQNLSISNNLLSQHLSFQ